MFLQINPRHFFARLKQNAFLRKTLSFLAFSPYYSSLRSLQLIGVTGTVGKTTTSYFIKGILEAANLKTGLIGTAGYFVGQEEISLPSSWLQKIRHILLHRLVSPLTTPDSFSLSKLLRIMKNKKAQAVVIEVSSFGLMYWRTWGLRFRAAVLTNISFNHHLAIHGGMENYLTCKKRLFTSLSSSAIAVLPQKSKYFSYFSSKSRAKIISYGLDPTANIWAEIKNSNLLGSNIIIHRGKDKAEVHLYLPGNFNIRNALAAIGAVDYLSLPLATIKIGLEAVKAIPGRLEVISGKHPFTVIVDKANTPAAFQGIAQFINQGKFRRSIIVYGNFGESPFSEREKLALIALKSFDFVIITEDDPQKESPQKGIKDFLAIAKKYEIEASRYEAIPRRRVAIREAIQKAGKNDIICILGRGNEKMMDYGNKLIPFDDREVVKTILQEEGYR